MPTYPTDKRGSAARAPKGAAPVRNRPATRTVRSGGKVITRTMARQIAHQLANSKRFLNAAGSTTWRLTSRIVPLGIRNFGPRLLPAYNVALYGQLAFDLAEFARRGLEGAQQQGRVDVERILRDEPLTDGWSTFVVPSIPAWVNSPAGSFGFSSPFAPSGSNVTASVYAANTTGNAYYVPEDAVSIAQWKSGFNPTLSETRYYTIQEWWNRPEGSPDPFWKTIITVLPGVDDVGTEDQRFYEELITLDQFSERGDGEEEGGEYELPPFFLPVVGGIGFGLPPPPIHNLSPRGRDGIKERHNKNRGKSWKMLQLASNVFGAVTEYSDLVNALWKALPKECKGGYYKMTYVRNGQRKTYMKYRHPVGLQEKQRNLLKCWEHMDTSEAIKNVLENQLEDYLIGKTVGALGKRVSKDKVKEGYHSPIGFGNLVNGFIKRLQSQTQREETDQKIKDSLKETEKRRKEAARKKAQRKEGK